MNDILLTHALLDQGFSYDEIIRLHRRGNLTRIRRGAYIAPSDKEVHREERHRRLIHATVPQLLDGSVVSHGSAAALHRLPVFAPSIARVHVTRPCEGQRRPLLHLHCAPLVSGDVTVIDGIAVTSVARTVLDLARTARMEHSVPAADRALRLELPPELLLEGLARMERWPGVRAARRVVAFADPRAESVGESVSRVRIHLEGLPKPDLQVKIVAVASGVLLATVDFYWEKQRVVGEFDGKGKYGELLLPGQRPKDAVYAEKRREDVVRAEDHEFVRWGWDDCWRAGAIRIPLLRAFDRRGAL